MGLFGGTQIETNKRNLVRNVIAWIDFNRTPTHMDKYLNQAKPSNIRDFQLLNFLSNTFKDPVI